MQLTGQALIKADYLAKPVLLKNGDKTITVINEFLPHGFLELGERKPSQNPVHLTMLLRTIRKIGPKTIPLLL